MILSQGEIDQLIYWFRQYDRDGNGKITRHELKQAMCYFGYNYSDYEIDQIIWQADEDGDGKINFKEFVKAMTGLHYEGQRTTRPVHHEGQRATRPVYYEGQRATRPVHYEGQRATRPGKLTKQEKKELKYCFKQYDLDGSGKITKHELKQAMRNFGYNYSNYEVDQMIWEADKDGDGKVNFAEFVKVVTGKNVGSSYSSGEEFARYKKGKKYKKRSGCCNML